MLKVTREFIKARKKFTRYAPLHLTGVERINGGIINRCFNNAWTESQIKSNSYNKIICVSGWLIQPFDRANNCTAILQHWWNLDSFGRHYDTTPLVESTEEYVIDFDIYEFSRDNFEKINSNVTKNILYRDGKFELLNNLEEMEFTPIKELRTELLFHYESNYTSSTESEHIDK
jgi:hypothetical protein